jgi:methylmalonyl-CoA mutase N-terminal domain/subunit
MATFDDRLKTWSDKTLAKALQADKERRERFESTSGIPIERIYGPQGEYPDAIGMPGEFPFTRGIQPTMYRGRFWTMRQ